MKKNNRHGIAGANEIGNSNCPGTDPANSTKGMTRNRTKTCGINLAVAASLCVGAACLRADTVPANCSGANASDLALNVNTVGPLQVGQVVEYQLVLVNPQLTAAGQQNCRI